MPAGPSSSVIQTFNGVPFSLVNDVDGDNNVMDNVNAVDAFHGANATRLDMQIFNLETVADRFSPLEKPHEI